MLGAPITPAASLYYEQMMSNATGLEADRQLRNCEPGK